MIQYYKTETNDFVAIETLAPHPTNGIIAAYSLHENPKDVKIWIMDMRYFYNNCKRISEAKVSKEWKDALSIIKYVGV